MKDFLEYLEKHEIVTLLIKKYGVEIKGDKKRAFLNSCINKLNHINNFNDDLDIIGFIYEKIKDKEDRKALGEFYTPKSIVDYILNAVGYESVYGIENKKIIDISCGSGSFIIQIVKRLMENFLKNHDIDSISNLTIQDAKDLINIIVNNVIGIDINPVACVLCQINIQFALFEVYEVIYSEDENYQFPFFSIHCKNSLTLSENELYDFVVGNPPYLFLRGISEEQKAIIENGNFETNTGQYDYYQIFIEIGIRFLKNGGLFGYIIPDSLLALSNRAIIRKFIYNNTNIKEIYHAGPKFDDPIVSNIILILQKEEDSQVREGNDIDIYLASSKSQPKMLPQRLIKKWNYEFLIHLDRVDISIIEALNENYPKIKDINLMEGFRINISRGVELTKTGEIIYCERCKLYFPIPRKEFLCPECRSPLRMENLESIITENISGKDKHKFKPFLYSINRYRIKYSKYIDISKIGINYKNLETYEDRIIIRQLSQDNLICATYDESLSLTSQSFYNLKVHQSSIPEFNHLYVLVLINSKLLSYYFIKSFGSYKKIFPRILIEKIKSLPVKIPKNQGDKKSASIIIDNVAKMLNLNNHESNVGKEIQKTIDTSVYDLFDISEENRKYIDNYMKNL